MSHSEAEHQRKTVLEFLWRYYEIHIGHRASMLNYLLVASGFFLYGLSRISTPGPKAAISLAGFVCATGFLFLDLITLRKIFAAKIEILDLAGNKHIEELFGPRGESDLEPKCLRRDPYWTTLVEATLASLFLAIGISSGLVFAASFTSLANWSAPLRQTVAISVAAFAFAALLGVGLRNAKPPARLIGQHNQIDGNLSYVSPGAEAD